MNKPKSAPIACKGRRWCVGAMFLLATAAGAEQPDVEPFSKCTAIADREQRWRCYDEVSAAPAPQREAKDLPAGECGAGYTALSRQWNTRAACESRLYHLYSYKPNYLIARYSNNPDSQPTSANFGNAPDEHLNRTELKFQLSMKVKVAEQIGGVSDLWFAYTQQSNWQAFNAPNSRPFRETDYEPEMVLAFPLRTEASALGWTPRLVNFGFVHQSNGQSDPLSRSWNRAYAQVGVDKDVDKTRDRFALLVRGWYRFPERVADDNNPDIEHYLGYGDLVFFWRRGDSNLSALLRNNLQAQHNRGSLQLDWSIPVTRLPSLDNVSVLPVGQRELRFYLQLFTGYGETLIDYNRYQTTVGIGIMLADWM